jgi:urocanate hydratase
MDPEAALGGKLVYAGELDAEGCRLVRAANIAGAASLGATADAAAQRQAIRDGVIDFLVNSLEEALRILKNEIRKHNAVAVGVGLAPARVAAEMRERGVLPDLLRPSARAEELADFVAQGARFVAPEEIRAGHEFCMIADAPPDFEARALEMIPESDYAARRWLRLSPRFLGPQMRRVRSLACAADAAAALITHH